MRFKYLFLLTLGLLVFIITACTQIADKNELKKQAKWEDIDMMISDYIIKAGSEGAVESDKAFEVHKTYGIDADKTDIYVYTLVLYEQYNFEDEKPTSVSFMIEPVIFALKQNGKNQYIVAGCSRPEGGKEYYENIKKMFTDRYYELVWKDICSDDCGGLENLMDDKVREWVN